MNGLAIARSDPNPHAGGDEQGGGAVFPKFNLHAILPFLLSAYFTGGNPLVKWAG
jgi:hypothetical protein